MRRSEEGVAPPPHSNFSTEWIAPPVVSLGRSVPQISLGIIENAIGNPKNGQRASQSILSVSLTRRSRQVSKKATWTAFRCQSNGNLASGQPL